MFSLIQAIIVLTQRVTITIRVIVDQLNNDGNHGDRLGNHNNYRLLRLNVRGGGFDRKQTQAFQFIHDCTLPRESINSLDSIEEGGPHVRNRGSCGKFGHKWALELWAWLRFVRSS